MPAANDKERKLESLQSVQFFSGLNLFELDALCDFIYLVHIPANEIFIKQDEIGDSFYVILSGEAQVFWHDDQDADIALETFGPGECLGEMGYFTDGNRSASVRSNTELELVQIYYADLDRAFEVAPSLAGNVLTIVTKRLRKINFRFQENVQKTRVVEKSLQSLQSFIDMSEILSLRVDIEGLIERVVYTASKMMNADRASLFLLDPATGELWSKVAQGSAHKEIRVPGGAGVIGWSVDHDEFVNITEPYDDTRFNQEVDRRTGYRTESILCGPIKNLSGEIVGVIQVINKKDGKFNNEDETLFRAFAYQTTIALENFHVYQQMMRNHEKMVVMLDVATSLNQTLELNPLLMSIVGKITAVLAADKSSLFVLDKETQELWTKERSGGKLEETRIPADRGLIGRVVKNKRPINIKDAYEDRRFDPATDEIPDYRSKTILCVPIFSRNKELIGVARAINKVGGTFNTEDVGLLEAVASQIAIAIENAQLHDSIESTKNYLESVQESISNSIVTLDDEYKVVTANRAACELFADRTDGLRDQDMRELLGPANDFIQRHIAHVAKNHKSRVDYDLDLVLSDEKTKSVNINVLPLFDNRQEFQGLILIFEDITKEKRVKSTLSRYMTKEIADKVLEENDEGKLGGQHTKATVLFSDIRGFTTLAEDLAAVETVEFLNDYFTKMVDIIFRNKGILDKYIGDAVMAVYGVPYSSPDDAINAVTTALEMQEELKNINTLRRDSGEPELRFGIGINSGDVISGNVGSNKRMEYTVIGDSVNLASRLENLTKTYGNTILISEYTLNDLGPHFVTRPIDYVTVKGRNQPVQIFDVLGLEGYKISEEQKCFKSGFDCYRQRDFAAALEWFRKGSDADVPCRTFVTRCEMLQNNPPARDWNFVWDWQVKA